MIIDTTYESLWSLTSLFLRLCILFYNIVNNERYQVSCSLYPGLCMNIAMFVDAIHYSLIALFTQSRTPSPIIIYSKLAISTKTWLYINYKTPWKHWDFMKLKKEREKGRVGKSNHRQGETYAWIKTKRGRQIVAE